MSRAALWAPQSGARVWGARPRLLHVRFLLTTAVKDLRRRRRDPLALVLWAGIPLTVGLLMNLAFGGDGSIPRARLLVDDRDGSLVSRLFLGALGQGQLAEMIEVERVDSIAGRARIARGEASAFLVVPAGFGSAVLREDPAELRLVRNPAQRVLPGIVEETLSILVEAVFYLQRLLREPIERVVEGPPPGADALPDSTIAGVSVTINRLVERVQPYLFPPVVELQTTTADAEQAATERPDEAAATRETSAPGERRERSFGELFFPGMLVLALLFVAQGVSEDVWKERSMGTLRRVLATPEPLSEFLAGKLLAGAALLAGVSLVGLVAARWVFALPFANLPLAVLWATFAGTAMLALLVLVQLHASSARAGNLLTGFVIFPLAMAGGSFFPFELMPDWLARVGRWTPNGWALEQLQAVLSDSVDPAPLAAAFGGVLLVGVLAFALALQRLRRRFAQG